MKQGEKNDESLASGSPSARGRGLKLSSVTGQDSPVWSPSARGRGLKHKTTHSVINSKLSPSARGRGLKPDLHILDVPGENVALCTRAWIETSATSLMKIPVRCRPLHEGVD